MVFLNASWYWYNQFSNAHQIPARVLVTYARRSDAPRSEGLLLVLLFKHSLEVVVLRARVLLGLSVLVAVCESL